MTVRDQLQGADRCVYVVIVHRLWTTRLFTISFVNSLLILVLAAGSKGMMLAVVFSVIVVSIFMPSVLYFINKSINKNTEKWNMYCLKAPLKTLKTQLCSCRLS